MFSRHEPNEVCRTFLFLAHHAPYPANHCAFEEIRKTQPLGIILTDDVVYMDVIHGFPLPKGKCLRLLRKLYGLVQAPLAFYKLCREVYTGVGCRQLQSDECVFVRYEVNVKKGSKTAKELRTLTTLADLKVIPEEDRVYPDCPHDVAVVIILLYVDNTGVRSNCPTLVCSSLRHLLCFDESLYSTEPI
jgi:hypothetical protein